MTAPILAVVGAGPKAMAIVAKAAALASLGFAVPEIHVFERATVGAHWTGASGHTSGRQPLGTPPDKDVGFPYASASWGRGLDAAVDAAMQRFSWQAFLTDLGTFADWVDRGRPAPEHRQWARYLGWVAERAQAAFTLHRGDVRSVGRRCGRWHLTWAPADGGAAQVLRADGLVLTGPGPATWPAGTPSHERLLTPETFWPKLGEIAGARGRVAVVGAGETAAAIALALAEQGGPGLDVVIVSPHGMAYSRGESYRENRVYTDPAAGGWETLSAEHRREFVRRTDRGVFSQQALKALDQADNVELVAGRVAGATLSEAGTPVLEVRYGEATRTLPCDWAVIATGGDPARGLRRLLEPDAAAELATAARLDDLAAETLEAAICYDLALPGAGPKLHLPMLAGFAQGPGFPNLSCLGRLSDRILGAWARPPRGTGPLSAAALMPEMK